MPTVPKIGATNVVAFHASRGASVRHKDDPMIQKQPD